MNSNGPPAKAAAPKPFRRVLLALLLLGSLFYLVALVTVALEQRRLIYHPRAFSSADADEAALHVRLERWTNSAGAAIGWKRPSPTQPARGRVLVAYGNASYGIGCAHYADEIQAAAAFDVFILEYPGYGDRPGSPGETSLFRAADEALPLLGTNVPVYLVGESLGSGVAAYLAGTYPDRVAGAMLLSPYNRLADVAQYQMPIFPARVLLLDRFPSEDYLKHYRGPVGVMVDGWDVVVPAKFGLRLYHGYAGPKRLWEYPRGNHISIGEPPVKFWKAVVDFWQTNALRN